jgi:DNA mismatch repair protein MutL
VERPASVVKELIENAVDAGARSVSVEIEDAGMKLIRVSDDGSGMDAADARMCVMRHATSKIHSSSEIPLVETLGFRGEALPSIASVSRMEIVSRTHESDSATKLVLDGGTLVSCDDAGARPGTTVTVRDLFFNTPARLKFQRSRGVETGRAVETALKSALASSDVRFSVKVDGKESLSTPGTGIFLETIVSVYGSEFARSLLPVETVVGSVILSGFIGRPSLSRTSRSIQHFFVNGRVVRDQSMRWALEEAYSGAIPHGRYPVAFLFITVPVIDVDVNVHPAKAEVRFKDEQSVKRAILMAVSKAVGIEIEGKGSYETWAPSSGGSQQSEMHGTGPAGRQEWLYQQGEHDGFHQTVRESAIPSSHTLAGVRPVGQVMGTYIVAEMTDILVLIDQHAAQERINYEKALDEMKKGRGMVQGLVVPRTYDLTPQERAVLGEYRESLQQLGFEFEEFGGGTLLVRTDVAIGGVPVGFMAVLERLLLEEPVSREEFPGERSAAALAACIASVKAGEFMDRPAQEALIAGLARTREPARCPHGRPTVIFMDRSEIERRFGRK